MYFLLKSLQRAEQNRRNEKEEKERLDKIFYESKYVKNNSKRTFVEWLKFVSNNENNKKNI